MSVLSTMGIEPGTAEGAAVGGTSGALLTAILEILLKKRQERLSAARMMGLAGMGGVAGGLVGQGVGRHLYAMNRREAADE